MDVDVLDLGSAVIVRAAAVTVSVPLTKVMV